MWFGSSVTGRNTSSSPNSKRARSRPSGASAERDLAEGYVAALRPDAARFAGRVERGERLQADLDSRIVEQAKIAISFRLNTTPEVAFEILSGLARSQGREIEE